MRDLNRYPVTNDEKIAALHEAIMAWNNAMAGDDPPLGDITVAALAAIMDDLRAGSR